MFALLSAVEYRKHLPSMATDMDPGSIDTQPAAAPLLDRFKLAKKHVFSDDIRHQIQLLNRSDNYHGILLCLEDWVVILSVAMLSLKTAQLFPHNVLLVSAAYVLAVLVIGSRMRALSILAHDSSHGSLADNKHLNVFLGTFFTGWPILQSWSGYYKSHVIGHHQNMGHPVRDPDYVAMVKTGLYDKHITKNDVIFYLLSIPTPEKTALHARYFFLNHVLPDLEANSKEVLAQAMYWTPIVSLFAYLNALPTLVAFWIVPLLTSMNWFASLLDVLEHYPLMANTRKQVNLHQSRNRFLSGAERFFLGIHSEGYHLVHHLWPRLPCWNFQKAHEIMMMDSEYAKVHARPLRSLREAIEDVLDYFD